MSQRSTILVVGATGNTGQGVLRTLPGLVQTKEFRILGLTRSTDSAISKEFASIPGVEMVEKSWLEIDAAWVKEQNIVRAYVAASAQGSETSQFVDESSLFLALLHAGVKYVVRVSTHVHYVTPTTIVFHGRTHWAVENLLSQPEFAALQWTSLQPNFFTSNIAPGLAELIKSYRTTGKIGPLNLTFDEHTKGAVIDPIDVGVVGAHLLALDDPTVHSGQRYGLSGPEDMSGADIVSLVERLAGTQIPKDQINFRYTGWYTQMVESGIIPAGLLPALLGSTASLWDGRSSLDGAPTSPAVLALAAPKGTLEAAIKTLLK